MQATLTKFRFPGAHRETDRYTPDVAPRHPGEGVTKTNCILESNLVKIPLRCYKKMSRTDKTGLDVKYWELTYTVLVQVQSGPMLFRLSCDGKDFGAVHAEY